MRLLILLIQVDDSMMTLLIQFLPTTLLTDSMMTLLIDSSSTRPDDDSPHLDQLT